MPKRVKSGQITDSEYNHLFNRLAPEIGDKYFEIGIELGLSDEVLTNELETGTIAILKGNRKAFKMLQLWRNSVDEDKFLYSVLAAALEDHGFQRCAHKYCYTENLPFEPSCINDSPVPTHPSSPSLSPPRPVFPAVADTVLLHTQGNLD